MRQAVHDLKAMRVAARVSVETMAERLGISPVALNELEAGNLVPTEDLLEEWRREVGRALGRASRHGTAASRALRRWFVRLP